MSKIYMFGYGTFEESGYIYLLHDETFTYDEFENMIFESAYKFIMEEKKNERHCLHDFGDVDYGISEIMIKDYGFKPLKPDVSWTCFGWGSIFSTDDMYDENDEENVRLIKYLRSKGLSEKDDTYLQQREKNYTKEKSEQ